MNSETHTCQNCKSNFVIEAEDFAFYEKIKVPYPTWCPTCRQQRRYAWRNERTLYRRNCDLCQKSIVTIYSPDKPFKVYCLPCWWGDNWDPESYGRDFDFSRPFFEQFSELQHEVPRMALLNKNSVNSDYTNHSGDNKNVYFSFSCFGCENLLYCTWMMNSRDSADCSYVYEKGERMYECIDCQSSYQLQYCILANNSSNCCYCYDCNGCSDCFLSSNLRNQRYFFKNKQYSKEEYCELIKQYNLTSYSVREQLFKEFMDLVKNTSIHKYIVGERNVGCLGNMLYNCKNAIYSYDLDKSEDCRHVYGSLDIKDCMDIYHAGIKTELCYECHGCTRIYDVKFCHLCYDNSSLTYCDSCQNSNNLFGCVSIRKGEYYIFNKKYSKEEYNEIKEKIIDHMNKTGEYGEFFPPSIAPVYYNETRGNLYMPLTKEEVLTKGWNWEDKVPGVFNKGNIEMDSVPDDLSEINDEFISNIFTCKSCSKNYNITAEEMLFYKRENLSLPRKCADCREKARALLRLPRKLWLSNCTCSQESHGHNSPCNIEFETSHSPEEYKNIYCEECYKKEVL